MTDPAAPADPTRGLRPFAVLTGSLIDHFGTMLWVMAFLAWRGVPLGSAAPPEETKRAIEAMLHVPVDAAVLLFIGLAFVVIGAYAAGRLASNAPIVNGVAVSVISLVMATLDEIIAPAGPEPLWYSVLGFGLLIPAGLAGGRLARRRTIAPDEQVQDV